MTFPFLQKKKSLLSTGVLTGMIDIHTHLLPGVDDGVSTEKEAIDCILFLYGKGSRHLYLTPHVMEPISDNYKGIYNDIFLRLITHIPQDMKLKLAAEYMLDSGFSMHINGGLLTFADNRVLIETSYLAPPPNLFSLIYELSVNNYTPVIAHPERYIYLKEKTLINLKEKGCLFQMNLLSLSGYYGRTVELSARSFLKKQYYDFIGSDLHHLESYLNALQKIRINNTEEKEIKRLVANNQRLW